MKNICSYETEDNIYPEAVSDKSLNTHLYEAMLLLHTNLKVLWLYWITEVQKYRWWSLSFLQHLDLTP
jgi:hypothetical protein